VARGAAAPGTRRPGSPARIVAVQAWSTSCSSRKSLVSEAAANAWVTSSMNRCRSAGRTWHSNSCGSVVHVARSGRSLLAHWTALRGRFTTA
jgi:hypothetical protein